MAIYLVMALATVTTMAQQPIEGLWNTGNENTVVEIKEVQGVLEGKIYSSDNKDAQVGKLLVKELQRKGDFYNGKLYAIKRGQWVDATFTPGSKTLQIVASAGMRSKTVEWKRSE